MELVCNELSFFPLADNSSIAEQRFKIILKTFDNARKKYGFTHIRFPFSYATQQITVTQTLFEWISTIGSYSLKSLILALFRPPYTDDLNGSEMESFVESDYSISGTELPTDSAPFGLPIAYIKTVPSISFDSHAFWRGRKIQISNAGANGNEYALFVVYNICLSDDIDSQELGEWRENFFPQFVSTEIHLKRYLGYSKYKPVFTIDFLKQFYDWKCEDFEFFKHLLLLMKDIEEHPFSGGIGQTENLKYRGKEASKRININDRLSYSISDNVVTFIACKGHYQFHD